MTTGNRKARRAWAAALNRHTKRGTLRHIEIHHDEGCAIYTRERLCTCDPHRILKDDRGRVLARVEGAGFYDPLELLEVPA